MAKPKKVNCFSTPQCRLSPSTFCGQATMNHLASEGVSVTKNWFEEKASPPCKTSTSSFETEKVPAEMSKAQADQWHCPPPWTPTAPKRWWPSLTLKVFQARNAGLMNCLVGTWTNGLSDGQRSTPTVAYVCWETKRVFGNRTKLYISLYDMYPKNLNISPPHDPFCMLLKPSTTRCPIPPHQRCPCPADVLQHLAPLHANDLAEKGRHESRVYQIMCL